MKFTNYHDGVVHSILFDVSGSSVTLEISVYLSENARDRVPATIKFTNVDNVTLAADFIELGKSLGAGQVVDIRLDEATGRAHLYLTGAVLMVQAESFNVKINSVS